MEKYSADYEFYNENPTGRSVGDCAVRAVSIALGVDWETAYALMAVAGYNMGGMSFQRGGRGGNRGGNSNRGGSYEGGNYDGMSYARGDGRGRGRNARRDSMGRYSSERGYSRDGQEMADQLRDLMEDAPDESVRRDIERLLRKVEQM